MRPRFLVVVALMVALSGASPFAQTKPGAGAASPQEAVATLQKAAGDPLQALAVISPNGLKELANEAVTGTLMILAFSDPDDPMPGGPKPTAAELAAKKKSYAQAKALATDALKPYGLDSYIGKAGIMADATQKTLNATLDKTDNAALVTSLYNSLLKIGPLLGMKEKPKPDPFIKAGSVTDYKINGDKATAQNNAETMNFVKINGRWYIESPKSAASSASGASSASSASGGSGASSASGASGAGDSGAAAPRAAASGSNPEVAVAGVQVAKITAPAGDFSAKPFHADNGTTLVLWVKLPAGQGLIELDEDNSLLSSVKDDKGSNMGGKFGSFPEEFKDGSGGIIEIKSSGFPASGATAILAEGSLSMSVANGTKKTRVPKVSIANNAKFTLGKTAIVVSDVKTDDDSLVFTLNLPRQAMTEIKNVVFLDAKGETIEGSKNGSGYMNDKGEMSFSVKTTAKVLTLEFEQWQALKTIKVPFKVKAGLGLE